MHDAATAKAQAVDELDEVAKTLKRNLEATKWALRVVRRAQARLVGIEVNTQHLQEGVHSVTSPQARPDSRPEA